MGKEKCPLEAHHARAHSSPSSRRSSRRFFFVAGRETQYFYNSVTGEATWTDPKIAPWIDEETGKKYWQTADGTATWESPGDWKEEWSAEHKMPFYVNKKTSESTWDLPEELAWERVNHEVEDSL